VTKSPSLRIAIAADHNGVGVKARLVSMLRNDGHVVTDLGAHDEEEVDYPPLCAAVGRAVAGGDADRGIVVGGSGMGEVIACNKLPGIRAGLCRDDFTVAISRGNNDANVLVLGAKVTPPDEAERLTASWLVTPFKGGRHTRRLEQIAALERDEPASGQRAR
jgi:ribose 5-phosphate isomerase B